MSTRADERSLAPSANDDAVGVLAAMVAAAPLALACWERTDDGDFTLAAANDRYLDFLGYSGPDPIGASIRHVIPDHADERAVLITHVMASGQPFRLDRLMVRRKSGAAAHWDVTLAPLLWPGPARVLITAREAPLRPDGDGAPGDPTPAAGTRHERDVLTLQGLARTVMAAARGEGIDGVLQALADAVCSAFGLAVLVNFLDEDEGTYVVRAGAGEHTKNLIGTWNLTTTLDEFLDPVFEVVPGVFFVPYQVEHPAWERLGENVATPAYGWEGPGHWHPEDGCFVVLRTSGGRMLGALSVDSPVNQPIPDEETFGLMSLFAEVGANAAEVVLAAQGIVAAESEREVQALRRELVEEVMLHRHLLEIGNRLGLASAAVAPDEIFPLVGQRLGEVVPIKSLTISRVDHGTRTISPIYHSEPGPVADAMLRFVVPFGAGASGRTVVEQRSVISNAGQSGPAVDVPDTASDDEHLLAVPVLVDELVRAVLTLHRPWTEPPFTPSDGRRAEVFAQYVASALLLVDLAQSGEELAASRKALAAQVEQLESLNHLKDEFVANVSHELRTPLTAVIGNIATVSRNDLISEDDRRELLDAAERQAKRLGDLLENLLAASRLAGEDPVVAAVPVEVESFLKEVADTLRSRAPRRGIRVNAAGAPTVFTDPTLLYRILFNLGDNAIKYSEGPMTISAKPSDGGVRILVRDRGIGIAPEDLPRIFGRFHQLDGSNSRRVGGVGLGLYLSKRAAELLGGRIDVESRVGAGSTFSLWLPAER